MTLVLAVAARDSVVIVADGQATGGDAGEETCMEVEKLGDLHGRIAFGCAGSAGLRQRIVANLQSTITRQECGAPITDLRPKLFSAVNVVQHEAATELVQHNGVRQAPHGIAVLFGGVADDGDRWIYEITWEGRDEIHEVAEAIGSARRYAITALLTRKRQGLGLQSMDAAGLLAYRVIHDVLYVGAHEIGKPITMYVVQKQGAQPVSDDGITALHQDMIGTQKLENEILEENALDWRTAWQTSLRDPDARPSRGPDTAPKSAAQQRGVVPPDTAETPYPSDPGSSGLGPEIEADGGSE